MQMHAWPPEGGRYSISSIKSVLCLSAFFLLSGITRVPDGASPDLRALRRASTPLSNRFFFRLAISALLPGNLRHRAPALINRFIRIRKHARIGIRDVNFPKRLPPDLVRSLPRCPLRIEQ